MAIRKTTLLASMLEEQTLRYGRILLGLSSTIIALAWLGIDSTNIGILGPGLKEAVQWKLLFVVMLLLSFYGFRYWVCFIRDISDYRAIESLDDIPDRYFFHVDTGGKELWGISETQEDYDRELQARRNYQNTFLQATKITGFIDLYLPGLTALCAGAYIVGQLVAALYFEFVQEMIHIL